MNGRSPMIRHRWFQDLAKDFIKIVSEARSEIAIRALAVLNVVMQHASDNLSIAFPSLAEMITSLIPSTDEDMEKQAVMSLPALIHISPETFMAKHASTMDHLIACLRNQRHIPETLEAIEKLVQAMIDCGETRAFTHADVVADCITEICTDVDRSMTDRQAAVKCVGQLALILEQDWKPQTMKLLSLLLSLPIDQSLLDALWNIQDIYPTSRPTIQSSLRHTFLQMNDTNNSKDPPVHHSLKKWITEGEWVMGLKLLVMFRLEVDTHLLSRCMDAIERALGINMEADSRKAATDACFYILISCADRSAGDDISVFLDQLCDVLTAAAVMDTCNRFRIDLISELLIHEELHERLSQDAIVRRLGYALYDAHLSIRQLTVQLLSRLSLYNVSAVRPYLRELLSNLMDDLRFNGNAATTGHIVGNGALLLRTVIIDQQQLVEMHRSHILELLLHKLERCTQTTSICRSIKDPTTEAICALLLALTEIIKGTPPHLLEPNVTRLANVLTHFMKDGNDCEKQLMAVKALQQICDASGEMLMQRLQSSDIHACLSDLKNCPRDAHVLNGVIRSLSKWDPTLRPFGSYPEAAMDINLKSGSDMHPFPTDEVVIGDEGYFNSVAIHALLAVLEDTRNTDYDNTIKCLISIFRLFQKSGVIYLQRVIPVLIKIIRQGDDRLRRMLLAHVSDLVRIAGSDVRPYIDVLMKLCLQFWSDDVQMTTHVLNVIRELADVADIGFSQFLGEVVPRLGKILSDTDAQLMEPALAVLQACDVHLGPYLPVLFPTLVQLLQKVHVYESPMPLNVQRKVLETLRHILHSVSFRDEEKSLMASKLFLTLVGLIRREEALKVDAMDTLVVVISVLGSEISRVYSRQLQQVMEVEEHLLIKGMERLMDPDFDQSSIFAPDEIDDLCLSSKLLKRTTSLTAPFELDIEALSKVWNTSDKHTKEDWEEWIRCLGVECLRQSPSDALRACHVLAQIHASITKWLFKYSLLSIWSKLNEEHRHQLQAALEMMLKAAVPSEVLQPIVGLGEYLYLIEQQDIPVSSELTQLDALQQSCHSQSNIDHYRKHC